MQSHSHRGGAEPRRKSRFTTEAQRHGKKQGMGKAKSKANIVASQYLRDRDWANSEESKAKSSELRAKNGLPEMGGREGEWQVRSDR